MIGVWGPKTAPLAMAPECITTKNWSAHKENEDMYILDTLQYPRTVSTEVAVEGTYNERIDYNALLSAEKQLKGYDIDNQDGLRIKNAIQLVEEIKKKVHKLSNENEGIAILSTTYGYSTASGIGRQYGDYPTLQQTPKWLRSNLCSELTYDIDIVNCFPTILYQLAIQHNEHVPKLKHYVEKREETLKQIMIEYNCSRTAAKSLFIETMNGGTFGTWKHNFKLPKQKQSSILIKEYIKEVTTMNTIFSVVHKDNLMKYAKKRWDITWLVLHTEENKILKAMEMFFTKNGYTVDVLVYDGIMVRRDKIITDQTLRNVEEFILDKTKYSIKLQEKKMVKGKTILD